MTLAFCSDNTAYVNMLNIIYLAALGAISMHKEYCSKLTSVLKLTYGVFVAS